MKDELFNELVASIQEAGAIHRGELQPSRVFHSDKVDIKAIRSRFGLSQTRFASLLNINVGTLRNWEQGHRKPQGPARVLLQIASTHPEVFLNLAKNGAPSVRNIHPKIITNSNSVTLSREEAFYVSDWPQSAGNCSTAWNDNASDTINP